MKLLFLLVGVICTACHIQAAEWYETLRPGTTRNEVIQLAGKPSESSKNLDIYTQSKGHIDCTYSTDNLLQDLTYYDTPDGAVSATFYALRDTPNTKEIKERTDFLKKGEFANIPNFSGRGVYTHKYRGTCYGVNGSFIVVEPIITLGGECGYFTNKTARLSLIDSNGTEKVLYRAAEHWQDLKPPGLSDSEVQRRSQKLLEMGTNIIGAPVAMVFGQGDSYMGSGIDYRLFYLEDALIIAACESSAETIYRIQIVQPGLGTLTLKEWLTLSTPAKARKP